jgi:hypothetical protein
MDAIWVVAIIVWVVSAVIKKAGGKGGGEPELPRRRGRRARVARPRPIPEEVPDPRVADWQREIEELLGVRTGPAGGPLGRPAPIALPEEEVEEEGMEERESLEVEEQVVSVEGPGDRSVPEVRDHDEEAGAVISRRLAVAEAHGRGRTAADHARIDQLLRTPVEAPRAAPRAARPPLRQAMLWREILGPPLALRDGPPERR